MASSCIIGHSVPWDMLSVVRGAVCSILSTIGPKPTDPLHRHGLYRIQASAGISGNLTPASIRCPAAFGIGLHFEPAVANPGGGGFAIESDQRDGSRAARGIGGQPAQGSQTDQG